MKQILFTDPVFECLSVPMKDDEKEELENSIIRNGCFDPIITWNGTILDGHKRYRICVYEEIAFKTEEMKIKDRDEAIIWLCSKRLPTVRKHSPIYRYLIGKWYMCKMNQMKESRKKRNDVIRPMDYSNEIKDHLKRTSYILGNEIGVSRSTVERSGVFCSAMDKLVEKESLLFEAIMKEKTKFDSSEIIRIAQYDKKKLEALSRKLLGDDIVKMRSKGKKKINDDPKSEVPISVGIKEMPAYDPDMEIRGLTLTIPTWRSAIIKARSKMQIDKASEQAKRQLKENLMNLDEQIHEVLEVLKV